jgi:hypothetical protein
LKPEPSTIRGQLARLVLRRLDGILAYCHEAVPFGKVEASAWRPLANGSMHARFTWTYYEIFSSSWSRQR